MFLFQSVGSRSNVSFENLNNLEMANPGEDLLDALKEFLGYHDNDTADNLSKYYDSDDSFCNDRKS